MHFSPLNYTTDAMLCAYTAPEEITLGSLLGGGGGRDGGCVAAAPASAGSIAARSVELLAESAALAPSYGPSRAWTTAVNEVFGAPWGITPKLLAAADAGAARQAQLANPNLEHLGYSFASPRAALPLPLFAGTVLGPNAQSSLADSAPNRAFTLLEMGATAVGQPHTQEIEYEGGARARLGGFVAPFLAGGGRAALERVVATPDAGPGGVDRKMRADAAAALEALDKRSPPS